MRKKFYKDMSGKPPFIAPRVETASFFRVRGFSFIELVVYLGLLLLVMVSVFNMLSGMNRAYRYLKSSRQMQTSAVEGLDRMVREIRNAISVDVAQSTLDSSPGVLTLNTTTATSSAQVIKFFLTNGVLHVSQDSGDLGPLTLSDVTVSNLVFRHMNTGISEAVTIEMTLLSGGKSANFYATAVLRDSY